MGVAVVDDQGLVERLRELDVRAERLVLRSPAVLAGAVVVEPGLPHRAHPVAAARQPLDLGERLVEPPLGRQPRRLVGVQRDAGDDLVVCLGGLDGPARRPRGRSRSARSGSPRPTRRASSASATGTAGSSRSRAMSRWQWLSTTGCGSASGSGGSSSVARSRAHERCTASYTTRLGTPDRRATSTMACLRGTPSASSSATRAARVAGSVDRLGRGRTLDDDRHLATDTRLGPPGQLGQRAAAYLLVGLGQLTAHGSAAIGPEHLGHRDQASRGCGAATRRTPSCARPRRPPRAVGRAPPPCAAGTPRSRTGRRAARTPRER